MPASPRLSRFLRRLSAQVDADRQQTCADHIAQIAYEDLHRYLGRRVNIGDVPISTVDGSSRYDRFEN
jgi:hypothetical protein